jgi:hypothetical protein
MKKKERKEVPFFARFLENQKFPRVKTDLKAGPGNGGKQTLKYPNDDAEGGGGGGL